jgi:hypothetical protein
MPTRRYQVAILTIVTFCITSLVGAVGFRIASDGPHAASATLVTPRTPSEGQKPVTVAPCDQEDDDDDDDDDKVENEREGKEVKSGKPDLDDVEHECEDGRPERPGSHDPAAAKEHQPSGAVSGIRRAG